MSYHQPVLARQCIEALAIQRNGVYVDATFGGGGHSRLLLEQLGLEGRLIAFDQDADALTNLPEDGRLLFVQHNFRHIRRFLRLHEVDKVHGLLADLGVSSHQFDTAERGFSYRFDAELDMRMNQSGEQRASDILNTYTAEALQTMFSEYGEVRNARTLAQELVARRQVKPFETVADLLAVAEKLARGARHRYLAQVFQALRIELNDEMGALRELLESTLDLLHPGGRLVVLSYHSLEDRMVKNFLKTGRVDGAVQKDFYGNIDRPFEVLTRKAVEPDDDEIAQNPRARSARLRVGARKV